MGTTYTLHSIHFVFHIAAMLVLPACMGQDCGLWMYYSKESCKCGATLSGTVLCFTNNCYNISYIYLKRGYCMTNDNQSSRTVVSFCIYSLEPIDKDHQFLHYKVKTNSSFELCKKFSRQGIACEECIDGYSMPVFSYNLSCVKCSDYSYNWLKYIAIVYIPLTILFFLIIVFRVSVTAGPMVGFVIISQILSTPRLVRIVLVEHTNTFVKILIIIYSIWNMEIFQVVAPSFCLKPGLSSLDVLMLEYVIAVYPMVLLLATYIVVELRDRCFTVRLLLRPLTLCLHHFRKEWDIKSSLIGSFATVLVMAYSKILDISFSLLTPTYLFDVYGKTLKTRVYYNPNISYLDKKHIPYFCIATIMIIVFNVIPLLMFLFYPWKWFHKLLYHLKLQNRYLYIFMDALTGCYKHKPRDLRFFPALFLAFQFLRILIRCVSGAGPHMPFTTYALLLQIILLVTISPFKVKWHNWVTVLMFLSGFIFTINDALHLESYILGLKENSSIHHLLFSFVPLLAGGIPPTYGLLRGIVIFTPSYVKKALTEAFLACRAERIDDSLPYRLHISTEDDSS